MLILSLAKLGIDTGLPLNGANSNMGNNNKGDLMLSEEEITKTKK